MKWIVSASLLALAAISNSQNSNTHLTTEQAKTCGPSVAERLQNYFDNEEIRPTQVVNNIEDTGAWKSKTSTIRIGNHTIEWVDTVGRRDSESSIKIDGEMIALKDKRSTNQADGDRPIDLRDIEQWDQIKLYKLNEGDVVGITMLPRSCTGLMCGVAAQLIYDVKTKQKTYFGTFRTDDETRLFRITSGNDYYYVSKNFNGDPHGLTSPQVITYELFKREKSGRFVVQKNAAGEKYYIRHTVFPDMEFKGGDVVPKKELSPDTLEQNWIEKIE